MKALAFRLFLCVAAFGLMLYGVIREQNRLTRLRLVIPELEKRVRRLEEENHALSFEVLRFRSAKNLWKLKDQPQFAEMEFPNSDEVLVIEQK